MISLSLWLSVAACSGEPPGEAGTGGELPPTPPNRGVYQRVFYPERLNLPTLLEKFGDTYFIVDSYNNRLIASDRLDRPIADWQVIDQLLSRPHSLAAGSGYLVLDDTDAHAINVYRKRRGKFTRTQTLREVGARPHRVQYDPTVDAFFVLASESQEIVKLAPKGDKLTIVYKRRLPFLGTAYTRAMRIIDGRMVFVSGPGAVVEARHRDDSFAELARYSVPQRLASGNDIIKVAGRYYLTATMKQAVSCARLADLERDACDSVYADWDLRGNPYYFSEADGLVYLAQVAGGDNIVVLKPAAAGLRPVQTVP